MTAFVAFNLAAAVTTAAIAVSNLPRRFPEPTLARLGLGATVFLFASLGTSAVSDSQDDWNSALIEVAGLLFGAISTAVFLFLCGLYLTKTATPETYIAFSWRRISQGEAELRAKLGRMAGLVLMAMSPMALLYMIWLGLYG